MAILQSLGAILKGAYNGVNDFLGSNIGQFGQNLMSMFRSDYWHNRDVQHQDALTAADYLYNDYQAQAQRDWLERMYNENNFYNTPAAQMERARAAGLNPSLLYGQPIAEAQAASGAAEASAGIGSTPSLSSPSLNSLLSPEQRDLMRAQAEEIRSRIPVNQQRVNEIKARIEDLAASVLQRRSTIELQSSQKQLTDASRENISFEQQLKSGYLDIEYGKYNLLVNKTAAEIREMNANTRALIARAGVTERQLQEMIWTYQVRLAGLQKQNLLTDAKIAEADATAEKLRQEGVRLDQIVNIDSVREYQMRTIIENLNSDNLLDNLGGLILYSIEYGASHIQQMSYFK